MDRIKVAIYIRVSTLDQAREGYSLEAQENTLRKWAFDKKFEIFDLYADRGISGKSIAHRPEMRRLLADAKERKFNMVSFWALSRFSRSVSDLYNIMEKFQKWDISMISYTEAFDTSSSMGRAMIGIIGVFAQLERELISERVSAALAEKAAQGKPTCYNILGYDYDKKTKTLFVNKQEAVYVRFVYEKYLIYKNLSQVVELCINMGYSGRRGRTPKPQSILVILTRPVYCGYNSFHGKIYKGNHEPIITVQTYNRVQNLLRKQGKIQGRTRITELINLPDNG